MMKKSTIGFFLILVIGIGGILIWKFLSPKFFEKKQRQTSDATGTMNTLRIGGDNYLGYWFIQSPELRKQCAKKGLQIVYHDDGGTYAKRLELFAKEEYDCIVLPINSYLEHGAAVKYPGVIAAAISESKGADGIVAFSDRVSGDKINQLNDSSLKIVYTANSPSSFLLDLIIADFDLDQLQTSDDWKVQAEGSAAVLGLARKKQGDVFVLWEPDLSKALEIEGLKYIWGSDRFSGYIIDVFVFHRNYLKKQGQAVKDFLTVYFSALSLYGNNQELMVKEMSKSAGISRKNIDEMTKKIDWFSLSDNCRTQFGIPLQPGEAVQDGVINTIIACTDVMIRQKVFSGDPLAGNPYLITNSSVLEELSKTMMRTISSQKGQKSNFRELKPDEWKRLREVGTFRIEPITFQSWNNLLTDESKERIDKIALLLTNNYPHYRIVIRGHTGLGGEEKENIKLSAERADVVKQYLTVVHGMDDKRMYSEGVGSAQPPQKRAGESSRAYQYRLARVEFIALEDNPL
jgi:outer membrane protein OmpA-like peptidoglycan-associated protein/ABC-type nitrate/sulfonate/bicarbonate transport system substrate-binding protein